jgi:hypothetical protein
VSDEEEYDLQVLKIIKIGHEDAVETPLASISIDASTQHSGVR